LPQDHSILKNWLDKKLAKIEHPTYKSKTTFDPTIIALQKLIESDPEIHTGFQKMFEQVPNKPPYNRDSTGRGPQIRDYYKMLELFNLFLKEAPEYEDEPVVFPFTAVLDWPMGTTAGYSTFLNPRVNEKFKDMLNTWSNFLRSFDSVYVLHNGQGFLSDSPTEKFTETYKCDATKQHYGFASWDAFFTREFQAGKRPLPSADNSVITSACESTVYRIRRDVHASDRFWLKGQPYSMDNMLNNDPDYAYRFKNGTVYQAYLASKFYHRWHSPVNGTIKKIVPVAGTYFAESLSEGFEAAEGPDPVAPNRSQAFLTSVATRVLIFIESNNAQIGLICFIAVGISEVSTCEVTVIENQAISKGDQLGMFHCGGSTYCLVFRPETKLLFEHEPDPGTYPGPKNDDRVLLNQKIATVPRG